MIDLGFYLLILAVVLFAIPYVLGPIIVFLSVSMPARYDLKAVNWERFVSERSRKFFDLHQQLLGLGFEPIGASFTETSHGKTNFALYRHEQSSVTASLLSSEAANVPEVLTTDFTQRFSDDFCLTVNNMRDASVFPDHRRRKMYRFPDEADPSNLFVKFNRIIYGLGRSDSVDLPAGREFEYISKFVEDEMLELVSSGVARTPTGDGRIRFTLRGACIATWKMLWPWKGILRRRDFGLAMLASKG